MRHQITLQEGRGRNTKEEGKEGARSSKVEGWRVNGEKRVKEAPRRGSNNRRANERWCRNGESRGGRASSKKRQLQQRLHVY